MTRIILVPSAPTDWCDQGRLLGDTDLPLSEAGHRQAVIDGRTVAAASPGLVRSGTEESARQSASIIAHESGLRSRAIKDLREQALGHWEGLTFESIRERFTKAYRQWRSDPFSVTPPDGEALADADKRLRRGVGEIIRKHPEEAVALVVGRFAAVIVRCQFADDGFARFWELIEEPRALHTIDAPAASKGGAGVAGNGPEMAPPGPA